MRQKTADKESLSLSDMTILPYNNNLLSCQDRYLAFSRQEKELPVELGDERGDLNTLR